MFNVNFFLNNTRFQFVSLCFLIILEINYFIRRKVPVASTFFFSSMMIWSFLYLIFDFGSVLTLILMDRLPFGIAPFMHKLLILSTFSIIMNTLLYVEFINGVRAHLRKTKTLLIISIYAFSIIVIFFSKFQHHRTTDRVFFESQVGRMIFVLGFLAALFTIIRTVIFSFTGENMVFRKKKLYIFFSMFIWILSTFMQFARPETLISSVGITLMVLLLYLGLENPSEYIDKESGAFNAYALKLFLQEKLITKKDFYILNLDVEDAGEIEKRYGEAVYNQLVYSINTYLRRTQYSIIKCPINVFRSQSNCFTLIISKNKLYDVEKILENLDRRFSEKWRIGKHSIELHAHCDFINCPEDIEGITNAAELIEFTDKVHTFTNACCFVRKVDTQLMENRNRQQKIIQIVQNAIANDGIEMYFQPIYNIKSGKFSNAEALVRLKDKTTIGFISPEEFIPIAENNGLIMDLSNNIFNQVFKFMSENKLTENGLNYVEVNLSGLQSVDADLPAQIKGLLDIYGLSPESINLEITESMAVTSTYMLKKNMQALKELGCSFSMDDFGTGYSNLSQMAKVDFELIKIDKSLLWPIFDEKNPDRENAKIILENMVKMILSLNKRIVVEGVETEQQFEYLKALGATYIQGYYFSKPLCGTDYLKFLEEKKV